MDGWRSRWMDGGVDGWMEEEMDGWRSRWMDGGVAGWMEE